MVKASLRADEIKLWLTLVNLLTEILFVKQNKNRAWFQVIPCGLDIKKHANIFSSADLLLLLDVTRL